MTEATLIRRLNKLRDAFHDKARSLKSVGYGLQAYAVGVAIDSIHAAYAAERKRAQRRDRK